MILGELVYIPLSVFFIMYLFMCVIVAIQGETRKIGFIGSLILSLFFTPLFVILIVLASDRLIDVARNKQLDELISALKNKHEILM
jgi:hypothetical protein